MPVVRHDAQHVPRSGVRIAAVVADLAGQRAVRHVDGQRVHTTGCVDLDVSADAGHGNGDAAAADLSRARAGDDRAGRVADLYVSSDVDERQCQCVGQIGLVRVYGIAAGDFKGRPDDLQSHVVACAAGVSDDGSQPRTAQVGVDCVPIGIVRELPYHRVGEIVVDNDDLVAGSDFARRQPDRIQRQRRRGCIQIHRAGDVDLIVPVGIPGAAVAGEFDYQIAI